jgi:hypothetical protein
MGIRVGRIVKEFVFKQLLEKNIELQVHGQRKKLVGTVVDIQEEYLQIRLSEGEPERFAKDEPVQVYFLIQNNYHTFESAILELGERLVRLSHPAAVYKNPQRKYERVRPQEQVEVFFTLKGQRVQLNFPKAGRATSPSPETISARPDFDFGSLKSLYSTFREKTAQATSQGRIVMLRDKIPERYEEKLITVTGKALWIPSTEEDFPAADPSGEDRIITRRELVRYEEALGRPAHVIISKLGNILYEKQKKGIHSELYCPVLHEVYIIGYLHLCNRDDRRHRIDKELLDWAWDFSRVLSYSLKLNGYFDAEGVGEHRYEAPIIDISAAGLLFAHHREELTRDLLVHTDMQLTLRFPDRHMTIGGRVRRRFQDASRCYFAVQFLQIKQEDLNYLFEKLYGKPYSLEEEDRWEGGTPPPPLDLFAGP